MTTRYGKTIIRKPGGKTLIIEVIIENNKIKELMISGDFFAYPEDRIDELEEKTRNLPIQQALEVINKNLRAVKLLGITPEDIVEGIRQALRNAGVN